MFRRIIALGCAASFVALAGCANVGGVTSDVTSFSSWPAGRTAGRYTFERLPSQAQDGGQGDLENAARTALMDAGFSESAVELADFNVQIGSRAGPYPGGYSGSGVGIGGGFGSGGRGGSFGGIGIGLSFGGPSYVEHEVSVLIRDRKTGQTLYEAHAHNDGRGSSDARVTEAMFAAALKDFPNPAVNPRRVVIDSQ